MQEKLQHRSRIRTIEMVSPLLMVLEPSYLSSSRPSREEVKLQLRRPLPSNLTLRNNPLVTARVQALLSKLVQRTMQRFRQEKSQKVELERNPAKKRQKRIPTR